MTVRFYTLLFLLLTFYTGFSQSALTSEKINWLDFQWNDPKEKDAIFLKSRLDTLDYNFNWHLDTGSPYTFINGNKTLRQVIRSMIKQCKCSTGGA